MNSEEGVKSPRILLTGAGGQVGRELLPLLAAMGEVIAPPRAEMDLSNAHSVRAMIREVRPRWIVNPGAYTAVDKAESEPELANAVNAEAVAAMAEEACSLGAGVLHFSTDYVFDGLKQQAYTETDATSPKSVYGRTKLAGETALQESGAPHAIFRTSWVYGTHGKNFLLTMLRLAREREVLRVVADQYGSPTWSRDLARMAAGFIRAAEARSAGDELHQTMSKMGGLFHAAGAGYTTWHGFASEIVSQARKREPNVRFADVQAITTAEYPTPARRPQNSRLDCTKLEQELGWKMTDWKTSLGQVVAEIGRSAGY